MELDPTYPSFLVPLPSSLPSLLASAPRPPSMTHGAAKNDLLQHTAADCIFSQVHAPGVWAVFREIRLFIHGFVKIHNYCAHHCRHLRKKKLSNKRRTTLSAATSNHLYVSDRCQEFNKAEHPKGHCATERTTLCTRHGNVHLHPTC